MIILQCVSSWLCLCVLTVIHQNSILPASVHVCVLHQIYHCCLLCDWLTDSSGHPLKVPGSLSCQRSKQENKAHLGLPLSSSPSKWETTSQEWIRLCVLSMSLPACLSLLSSRHLMDMQRSLIPYSPVRRGYPSLSSTPLLSPPLLLFPQHHKLSVKLTGPFTISQGSSVAHRTLLYLICLPSHGTLTYSRPAIRVCG